MTKNDIHQAIAMRLNEAGIYAVSSSPGYSKVLIPEDQKAQAQVIMQQVYADAICSSLNLNN